MSLSFPAQQRLLLWCMLLAVLLTGACTGMRPVQPEPPQDQPPPVQQHGGDLALLLPLTGPYGGIAGKIMTGAQAGVQLLAERGVAVRLEAIDTNQGDWKQKLEQLPASFEVVGGPLRPEIFNEITATGLHKDRVFFTFLQGLGGVTEGRDAWRFFSSPNDQIRTLLRTARREFGISTVGVLYPDEPFGKRIAQLFLDDSRNEGVNVAAMQAYPPEDPLRWSEIVAEFLYAQPGAQEMQAVFLPDVWSKVEMLVPHLLYHQREDLLILGSTLWGQTLAETPNVDLHAFRLAVFPGVWWEQTGSPPAEDLRRLCAGGESPGLWEALGFDFVRFVSGLGPLPAPRDAGQVNRAVQRAQGMHWSMAPIAWDLLGVARQDMFLFTPAQKGSRPADLQQLRARIQAVKSRLRP